MATTETEAPVVDPPEVAAVDLEKAVEEVTPPPEAEVTPPADAPPSDDQFFAIADVVLRFLLFASVLVAVVVLVTGKQTKNVSVPIKFENWPTLIYFVAAFSVAGFYSIITYFLSLYAIIKPPGFYPAILCQLIISDVVLLGIVAAATGGASTIGYLGLKGDSHVGWNKVCNGTVFCKHLGASIGVSIFSCVVLTSLVLFALVSLLKKVPK